MKHICPNCRCDIHQEVNDGWFTCENCNDSFTLQEVLYPSPTTLEMIIEAVEKAKK